MIQFNRYSYVRDLIIHYATELGDNAVLEMMANDVESKSDAVAFAKFIWRMADQIAIDSEQGTVVLGSVDNSSMMSDVDYEVSLYLANRGYGSVWDEVCDES